MVMLLPTPSHLSLTEFEARQVDLTTSMEAVAVADTVLNLQGVVAASEALVLVAELEVEVEHTVVEVEVELTVLTLKTY